MGAVGRPTVGAAVPCRPHGVGRGDQENVERGGVINRVENVENVERGAVGRPTVGAAVPCRPHDINRVENVEDVEWGFLCVALRISA